MVRFFPSLVKARGRFSASCFPANPWLCRPLRQLRRRGRLVRYLQFYDYVRSSFGHRLSATNYQNQWLRIVATIDGCIDASPLELKVLKTVGILNLLDADDLLPTHKSVIACLSMFNSEEVDGAIERLGRCGIVV